jgi:cytochrome P450
MLVKAHTEDGLTAPELLNFCKLLLVAGNETTSNLIGNIVLALLAHPEQRRKLRQRPELVPRIVEEVLRYDAPTQLVFRTTTQDVPLHGITIPAGAKVALLWGAANRDPEVFPHADRFDPERDFNPHVGFGYGIHYCLGAALARLQARIATATILRRMRRLRQTPGSDLQRADNPLFRGLTRLPIIFEREGD